MFNLQLILSILSHLPFYLYGFYIGLWILRFPSFYLFLFKADPRQLNSNIHNCFSYSFLHCFESLAAEFESIIRINLKLIYTFSTATKFSAKIQFHSYLKFVAVSYNSNLISASNPYYGWSQMTSWYISNGEWMLLMYF